MPGDVSFAFRLLLTQRTLALTVIVTLAIGISSTVLMFTIINGVLLEPLPFPNASRLVSVGESSPGWRDNPVGEYTYRVWRERSRSFEHLAVMHRTERSIEGRGDPLIVDAAHVSANFFDTIGVRPALGGTFDGDIGGSTIVLSHGLWTRLGADTNLIGTTLRIVDRPYVVVGVMPPMTVSGPFIGMADYWTWSGTDPDRKAADGDAVRPGSFRGRTVIGRLRPGVSVAEAQSELTVIQSQLAAEYPQFYTSVGATVTPLKEVVVGNIRPALSVLFVSSALLLLLACANVANLLLARSVSRQKEIGIRLALGARPWHIVRQVLVESLILSFAGGMAGVLAVRAGLSVLTQVIGSSVPRIEAVSIDVNVWLFAVAVAVATGVLFGVAPALAAIRSDIQTATRDAARGSSSGRGGERMRRLLVSSEVALAIVLLAGSVLLIRSFMHLSSVNLGFRREHVLTAELRILDLSYPIEGGVREGLLKRLLARLQSLPGVTHAGASYYFPFSARQNTQYVVVEGRQVPAGQEPAVEYTGVIGDFLTAMGVPLIRGRLWTEEEMWERPGGVVVSESMARMLWPNEDPIGKRVTHNRAATQGWATVIGVVGDVRQRSVDQPPRPQWYFPYSNFSWPLMTLAIRTTGDPAALIPTVRQAVTDIDPNLPMHRLTPLADVVAGTLAERRLAFGLLAGFAAMSLLLAGLGVYATVANAVAQQTRELAIRSALGATVGGIVRLVMRDGVITVGVGCVVGLALSAAATRLMQRLLFDVSSTDAVSFAAAVLILSAIAGVACYLAARRAAAIDPASSLLT
jgi:putative ABC transport system permease protein